MTRQPPRHGRLDTPALPAPPPPTTTTTATETPPLDDSRSARDALDRLHQRASAAPNPEQVVEQATDAALAETTRLLWRAIWVAVFLFALGIATVIVLGLYTISINSDVSDLNSVGAVGANRARASGEVRGYAAQSCDPALAESVTLECANRDLRRAGLPTVEAPDGLAPSQLAALVGEARARLWYVASPSREEPRPGVSTPPTSGRFPGAR